MPKFILENVHKSVYSPTRHYQQTFFTITLPILKRIAKILLCVIVHLAVFWDCEVTLKLISEKGTTNPTFVAKIIKTCCLNQHKKNHSQGNAYESDECPKKFGQMTLLRRYLNARNSIAEFQFSLCNNYLSSKTAVQIHLKMRT